MQTYKSLLFLSETMIFAVWLAVPSKPSCQPIWLKVLPHCELKFVTLCFACLAWTPIRGTLKTTRGSS